jgi:hypothetical protein
VGPREMLMTCSMPDRQTEFMVSPLKKEMNMDLSWVKRGWVSKRSEAKWRSGLCPGVDLGV